MRPTIAKGTTLLLGNVTFVVQRVLGPRAEERKGTAAVLDLGEGGKLGVPRDNCIVRWNEKHEAYELEQG